MSVDGLSTDSVFFLSSPAWESADIPGLWAVINNNTIMEMIAFIDSSLHVSPIQMKKLVIIVLLQSGVDLGRDIGVEIPENSGSVELLPGGLGHVPS